MRIQGALAGTLEKYTVEEVFEGVDVFEMSYSLFLCFDVGGRARRLIVVVVVFISCA